MRGLVFLILAGCSEYNPGAALSPEGPPAPEDVPEGSALETFAGGAQSTVDVIVFGDTSGSMDEEMRTLGDAVSPFVDRLASHVDDWQLAAVTAGNGCTSSGILTPDTAQYAKKFADALVDPVFNDDEGEMGLQNVTLVVENSGRGDCNDGLVRGGMLQIVFVSDENEESPGFEDSPDYWRRYLERIVAVHGDASRVKMSAVAGPVPFGCLGADPGFGYDGPVGATGGKYLSICEDWADQLDVIADAVALRSTFPLRDVPVPETIQVWKNDTALAADAFSYDRPANTVTIDTPAGVSDSVAIQYELAN